MGMFGCEVRPTSAETKTEASERHQGDSYRFEKDPVMVPRASVSVVSFVPQQSVIIFGPQTWTRRHKR